MVWRNPGLQGDLPFLSADIFSAEQASIVYLFILVSRILYVTKALFMCTFCIRVQICTPLRRVHMPIKCVHTFIDLI